MLAAGGRTATGLGPPLSDRSKVMTQIENDVLILQVGGWGVKLITSPP